MTNNKKYYPWIVVALLWGVALLNYMDRQMLSTMKSAMMIDITELESATNFGRLMAVFLWIYGLMSPVAGMIADRINRKWLIVGSLFVWSFVTLMMGYSTDFNQIYILRAIMGVSEALYIPAGLSLITDYHQEKTRSLAVGIHMTGLYTGQALGGFGATIAGAYSWETTFHWFGIIGIAYSLVLILFLKEKKDHTVAKLDSEPGPKESPVKAAIKGMGMLFVNISFWIILLYFATSSLPGWATKNWLPTLFSENLSIDMSEAGPLSTFTIAISSFIGVIAGGILSDKWIQRNVRGRIYTGSIGLALTIPALLLLGFGDSFAMIVGGGLCFGIGFGIGFGFGIHLNRKMKLNVAYFQTNYSKYNRSNNDYYNLSSLAGNIIGNVATTLGQDQTTIASAVSATQAILTTPGSDGKSLLYGHDTFTRTNRVLGIGLDIDF